MYRYSLIHVHVTTSKHIFSYKYVYLFPADITGCSNRTDGCSQICTNTNGRFVCECNTGFQLNSDGATCNGEYYMKYMHDYVHTKKHSMYVQNTCTPYVLRILKHVLYLCTHLYNY